MIVAILMLGGVSAAFPVYSGGAANAQAVRRIEDFQFNGKDHRYAM
jgi:hypothetical protein